MKKLSVYIHIPFCVRKCFYCDFLSAAATEETKQQYVDKLIEEIEREAENYREYEVVSVFFGGGTPSVLKTEDTERIMRVLRGNFTIVQSAEITSEVNPKTADFAKLKAYHEMGFNRLSIGMQSTDDRELRALGRIHDYQDFLDVFEAARRAGFQNLNVDIMSALPGQSVKSYEKTLEKVLQLQPEHISAYSLIIEEGTPFYEWFGEEENQRQRTGECVQLPNEEEERRMYELTEKMLEKKGYHRYEISNYAKEGYACRHNQAYWTRQDYVGFGIGAASLIENRRFQNKSDLNQYLAGEVEKEEQIQLTKKECMEEFMFLGLRLTKGVEKEQFFEQFSLPLEQVYGDVLNKQESLGLLVNGEKNVYLTKKGLDVSNLVMAEFLLDE